MEMRIENFQQDNGQELVKRKNNFSDLKKFILSTKDGIALIDKEENEQYFRKKNIDDLFDIINENNTASIKYIMDELNKLKIFGATIKLTNGGVMTIERL